MSQKTIQIVADDALLAAVSVHRDRGGFKSLSKAAGDLVTKGAAQALQTYENQARFEALLIAEGLADTPESARRLALVAPQLARIIQRENAAKVEVV